MYNWNASCEAAPEIRYNATVGEFETLATFISPNGTEENPVDVWDGSSIYLVRGSVEWHHHITE